MNTPGPWRLLSAAGHARTAASSAVPMAPLAQVHQWLCAPSGYPLPVLWDLGETAKGRRTGPGFLSLGSPCARAGNPRVSQHLPREVGGLKKQKGRQSCAPFSGQLLGSPRKSCGPRTPEVGSLQGHRGRLSSGPASLGMAAVWLPDSARTSS